jgi:uncharacterized membrane protein
VPAKLPKHVRVSFWAGNTGAIEAVAAIEMRLSFAVKYFFGNAHIHRRILPSAQIQSVRLGTLITSPEQ